MFEFEALTCASCRSVDTYHCRFVELYGYSPTLVATDRQKARHYIRGLPIHIQRVLIGHLYLTFFEVVDQARQLEKLDGGHIASGVRGD